MAQMFAGCRLLGDPNGVRYWFMYNQEKVNYREDQFVIVDTKYGPQFARIEVISAKSDWNGMHRQVLCDATLNAADVLFIKRLRRQKAADEKREEELDQMTEQFFSDELMATAGDR